MAISSIINTGVQGMQKSAQSMSQSAQTIASASSVEKANVTGQDMVEPILNLQQEQHVFDASAKVVQTGSDVLGALLDIKA